MSPNDVILEQAERIDRLCDDFETAWRGGERPSIREWLGRLPQNDRPAAGLALIAVEVELLRQTEESISAEKYQVMFPELTQEIGALFSEAEPLVDTSVSRMQETAAIAATRTIEEEVLPATVGRFEVLGRIGAGAFGLVLKARDPQLDRLVAIKLPRRNVVESADLDRFLREAKAVAHLHHPNICPVYEVGTTGGRPYIVMRLVPGKSLAEYIARSTQPLPIQQAALIARKLALALDAAHHKGVVHRDLKPANIMIDQERKDVVVMDFGLARSHLQEDIGLTISGTILGTPAYMSPEQARADLAAIGPATDIYSLGVILHEMLTRQRPYDGSLAEVLGKILHVESPGPAALRPDIPLDLDALVRKCMAKNPRERFGSMRELADALQKFAVPRHEQAASAVAGYGRSPASDSLAGLSLNQRAEQETSAVAPPASAVAPPASAVVKAPAKQLSGTYRRSGFILLALLLALLPLAYFFGATVIHVITNQGELVIETTADDVEVTIRGAEAIVVDKAKDRRFVLTAGKYDVEVRELGEDGIRFATKRFSIVRGGRETFHARLEAAAAPPVALGKNVKSANAQNQDEFDRQFANNLLSLGIRSVEVSVGDSSKLVYKAADLPTDSFQVLNFDCWGILGVNDDTVGPILEWIERRNVETIRFHGNLIGDATVRKLVKLPSLKRISVGATRITPASVPLLAARTDLVELGLYERPIGDADVELLRGLVHLENLNISRTGLTDSGMSHLAKLTRLKFLNLTGCPITGAGVDQLRGLPLEMLIISETNFDGAKDMAKLTQFRELQEVHLIGLNLKDQDLEPLAECKLVSSLLLRRNHLTDAALQHLAKMKQLKRVVLGVGTDETNQFSASAVEQLRRALPACAIEYEVAN